jgi:hypothetical protein
VLEMPHFAGDVKALVAAGAPGYYTLNGENVRMLGVFHS